MKDCIIAQSDRGGATVGSTFSAPPERSTVIVGFTNVSLAAGIAPEAGATMEVSPRDLLEVLVLGSTLFICACHYLS